MQTVEIIDEERTCDVKLIRSKTVQAGMMSSWQSYEEVYPDDDEE